jgi:hypothetical protein
MDDILIPDIIDVNFKYSGRIEVRDKNGTMIGYIQKYNLLTKEAEIFDPKVGQIINKVLVDTEAYLDGVKL